MLHKAACLRISSRLPSLSRSHSLVTGLTSPLLSLHLHPHVPLQWLQAFSIAPHPFSRNAQLQVTMPCLSFTTLTKHTFRLAAT
jgi:hypothetical protein